MPLTLTWSDIAIRLSLTLLAGLMLGYNRETYGHPAGLRTTLLVGVAASLAMLQANWMLAHTDDLSGHLVTLDLMRLPLGILSGMGFIGGGAILRRGSLIRGLTTAATLWLVTVIGLCFGGGQLALGIVGTLIAGAALWLLSKVEPRLHREREATIEVKLDTGGAQDAIVKLAAEAGLRIRARHLVRSRTAPCRTMRWHVAYRADSEEHDPTSALVDRISQLPGVASVEWLDSGLEQPK